MHTYARFATALFLIAYGILLVRKPNLFKRGMWMKTGIAERNLSPAAYIKYSRGVGVFSIVIGTAFLAWAFITH